MNEDWRSYDSIADAYDAVWAARFDDAARHLVGFAVPGRVSSALDVGTGTGVLAAAVAERVAATGLVVGCDLSPGMLRRAAARLPRLRPVRADAARLPFPGGAFALVTAGFALSHLADHRRALAEAVRVLEKGGTLAVSNWAPAADPFSAAWCDLLAARISRTALEGATAEVAPSEALLSDPGRLRTALEEAELGRVGVEIVPLEFSFSPAAFVQDRALTSGARFARRTLGDYEWTRFRSETEREVEARFGPRLEYSRGVLLAAGRKR